MKIIGTLDTKDDGDLLKDVLDHLPGFDAIFAYNDGSIDNTEEILKNHPRITKYVNRSDFSAETLSSVPQHRRHHLLQMVKDEFDCVKEEIWVVRLEGDRYFMNTYPEEMVNRAAFYGLEGVAGVMVDCRIGPDEDWQSLDTYPDWHLPIYMIQTWGRIDDVHPVVAFRLRDEVQYSVTKPRPWPIIWGQTDYQADDYVTEEMAFFAHHGRRSPKYWSWAYTHGSRPRSKKFPPDWDLSSPLRAYQTVHGLPFRPQRMVPKDRLFKLSSFASPYNSEKGHRPYGGGHLRTDIINLTAIWNTLPPRKK